MDMKDLENKSLEGKEKLPNGIKKQLSPSLLQNATELNLSKTNIAETGGNIVLLPCLRELNLSHNKLKEVPKFVLDFKDLKILDISHNEIECFNDSPSFCHAIEVLNVSHNNLKSPPEWIWSQSPRNLCKLDISGNINISASLEKDPQILQCNTRVKHVILYNCRLGKHLSFLGTFPKAQEIELGTQDWSCYASNFLQEVPCQGLKKCYDVQRLNLTNTHIYTITPSISMFKNLKEINLTHNNLNGVPNEFFNLENLEICILSFNNILYLSDDIVRLKKLTTLCLDVNELCMIPQKITDLVNLKTLDLYDNNICEFPEGIMVLPELDLAQNYLEEPDSKDYITKRDKLRLRRVDVRQNGRKYEVEKPDTEHSSDTTEDEELVQSMTDGQNGETTTHLPSSPENWDTDSNWEPQSSTFVPASHSAYWLTYIKKKMKDGNFCPMDLHIVSTVESVKYQKMCYPTKQYESDGQFDDFSEDDS